MILPPTTGIYQIRNLADGRAYVGLASNVRRRAWAHRYSLRRGKHHSAALQADWDRLGESAFSFDVLELAERDMLRQRERHWIAALRPAYNTGFGGSPAPKSAEHKEAIAEASRRRWADPAYRAATAAKISAAKAGVATGPHSAARAEKIAAANRARWLLQVGVPLSAEARAKMSAVRMGKTKTAATRARIAAAMMGNENRKKWLKNNH